MKREKKDVARATVGKSAVALQEKAGNDASTSTHPIIDQTKAQLSEYYDNLIKCVNENKSKVPGNFYIVVITKKEKLLNNVIRNYFFARMTCPTPDYDQAVYFYDAKAETISFIWVIPDRETCLLLKANALSIAPEERELLGFVMDFSEGKLYKLAKHLNGEREDSVILEN